MKQGGFAPASGIFRGSKTLSELIRDDDLVTLLGEEYAPPLWTANPPQLNQREDNYLSMLGIAKWDEDDLVEAMDDTEIDLGKGWMIHKPDAWHQRLYALLVEYAPKLTGLEIVKCGDECYRRGCNSYFPADGSEFDYDMPRVSKGVFNLPGSSKEQRDKAKQFLMAVGVREVDELVEIQSILEKFYNPGKPKQPPSLKLHIRHLERFLRHWEQTPRTNIQFCRYEFLLGEGVERAEYCLPSGLYLDKPYRATGLDEYFKLGTEFASSLLFAKCYHKCSIDLEKLEGFALYCGVIELLPIIKCVIPASHSDWRMLSRMGGKRSSSGYVDEDFDIPGLKTFFDRPSLQKSKLLWESVRIQIRQQEFRSGLKCRYGKNQSNIHEADSSLVYTLKSIAWVPQKEQLGLNYVKPADAMREKLPEGFEFDNGWGWVIALDFGNAVRQKAEEARLRKERETAEYKRKEEIVKDIGFSSPEEAAEIARFIRENRESFRAFKSNLQSKRNPPPFPIHPVINPARRREKLGYDYSQSPAKAFDIRERRVRVSANKIDPEPSLRELYKIGEGELCCQICKNEMPFFKREPKIHYFEAVEILSIDHLPKEHESQYLALCPTCAAKYKEFVKSDTDEMSKLKVNLLNPNGCEIPISLGDEFTSIRFVDRHLFDLQTILKQNT